MKKVDLGKPSTVLNSNMNRKTLYVDSNNMGKICKNISRQLNALSKSFESVENILNKMAYKKMFIDECSSISVQCSKKCGVQAKTASTLMDNLDDKYKEDLKMYVLNNLDERISYLESIILDNN